jgi:hypothetical protein
LRARQARANVSRVPPLPPLVAVALLAIAGVLASRLPRPAWIARALQAIGAAAPLGWYVIGVVLGPVLGLLDRPLLDACAPVLACAIGWIAARAGAALAAPRPPDDRFAIRDAAAAGAALVIPAALLFAAGRYLAPPIAPDWTPEAPVIATLAAAVTLAGAAGRRYAIILALLAATGGILAQPSIGRVAGLPFPAAWAVFTIAGVALAALLANQIARRAAAPLSGTIAAICLGAGVGFATGASPLVVCALVGAALARWSPPFARLSDDLAITAPAVAAVLWMAAGAQFSGPFPSVALAAALLAFWPLVHARLARGASRTDQTFGLAVASSFAYTAGPAAGRWGPAVVTAAAIGLLVLRAIPAFWSFAAPRLTSGARRAEVSA